MSIPKIFKEYTVNYSPELIFTLDYFLHLKRKSDAKSSRHSRRAVRVTDPRLFAPGFCRRSCLSNLPHLRISTSKQRATFVATTPTNQRDGPQDQHLRCDSPRKSKQATKANILTTKDFSIATHQKIVFFAGCFRPQALILLRCRKFYILSEHID